MATKKTEVKETVLRVLKKGVIRHNGERFYSYGEFSIINPETKKRETLKKTGLVRIEDPAKAKALIATGFFEEVEA